MSVTEKRTLIISTHQVHDVEQLLDHILILTQQSLLMDASTAEIQQKYVFGYRTPAEMDSSVIYAEPSLLVLTNLFIYEGAEHKQEAQKPKAIDINLYK